MKLEQNAYKVPAINQRHYGHEESHQPLRRLSHRRLRSYAPRLLDRKSLGPAPPWRGLLPFPDGLCRGYHPISSFGLSSRLGPHPNRSSLRPRAVSRPAGPFFENLRNWCRGLKSRACLPQNSRRATHRKLTMLKVRRAGAAVASAVLHRAEDRNAA
jgi:hypothetical protein